MTSWLPQLFNSRPLTYINADDLEEPLTPSHFMYGYRLLSLPDPTNTDEEDPDYDYRSLYKVNLICCLGLWAILEKMEDWVQELRKSHHTLLQRSNSQISVKARWWSFLRKKLPGTLWRLGWIEQLVVSSDGMIRSAFVWVSSKSGHPTTLWHPVQHLYLLEVSWVNNPTCP